MGEKIPKSSSPTPKKKRTFPKRKGFQKSEIGLEIERSDTSSHRVCHACALKIRLHNFISSSLQKEKQTSDAPDDLSRCKRILPTTFWSKDRGPQSRKGFKTTDENSIAVRFSDNFSEIAL